MKQVSFPNLNINLQISKVAFSIFNIKIHWYAIIIVFAIAFSVFLYSIDKKKFNIKNTQIHELLIYLLPISIIFARIYYVLFKFEYYKNNPIQILNIRDGGLAIYGGLIGGTIVAAIYCKKKKINLLNLLDSICPYIALRSKYRKMGKFCKCRSIWNTNSKFT